MCMPILASCGCVRGAIEAPAAGLRGVIAVCACMEAPAAGLRGVIAVCVCMEGASPDGVRGESFSVRAAATELRGVKTVFMCMSESFDQWCRGVRPAARIMAEPREMGDF